MTIYLVDYVICPQHTMLFQQIGFCLNKTQGQHQTPGLFSASFVLILRAHISLILKDKAYSTFYEWKPEVNNSTSLVCSQFKSGPFLKAQPGVSSHV